MVTIFALLAAITPMQSVYIAQKRCIVSNTMYHTHIYRIITAYKYFMWRKLV